jgi:uncharacterized protein YegP (UPF0339 family)
MSYVLKKDSAGKFMFNLKAKNGEVILTSQSYVDKAGALNGIDSVRRHGTNDANFDRQKSSANEPYFTLNATNGQVIGRSEMYSSVSACENGIESVKKNCADAVVDDKSGA